MNKEAINQNSVAPSSTARRVTIALTGIIVLFCVIGPNIEWMKSPLTPSVKVTIKEANTSKPISNMQVIVSHNIRYVFFPGSGHVDYSNSELKTTNTKGELVIRRMIKPISFSLFSIFSRDYDGTEFITISDNSVSMATTVRADGDILLNVEPYSNATEVTRDLEFYSVLSNYNFPSSIKSVINSVRIALAKKIASFK